MTEINKNYPLKSLTLTFKLWKVLISKVGAHWKVTDRASFLPSECLLATENDQL